MEELFIFECCESEKSEDPEELPSRNNNFEQRVVYNPQEIKKTDKIFTVIFDLDETLIYGRSGDIFVRPYLNRCLEILTNLGCDLILWTAASYGHTERALNVLEDETEYFSNIIVEGPWLYSYTNLTKYHIIKDLKLINRPLDKMLFVENCEFNTRFTPNNSIILSDYDVNNNVDDALLILPLLVKEIIDDKIHSPLFGSYVLSLSKHAHQETNKELCFTYYKLNHI